MTQSSVAGDVSIELSADSRVGIVEMWRPPNNFLDITLLDSVLAAMRALDGNPDCAAIVLRAAGKHFCAGRDFSRPRGPGDSSEAIYGTAAGLFEISKPWIAAVQGGAVGAGLGLALAADFRIATPRAYFSANFVTHGLHSGFGVTLTLPRIVGQQKAAWMLYSGARIDAPTAAAWGMADQVVPEEDFVRECTAIAATFAAQPPEAVKAVRTTLRAGLLDDFRRMTAHELTEQNRLRAEKSPPASGSSGQQPQEARERRDVQS